MAMMTAGPVRDGARRALKSRLTNPFLAIAMALGYLVGTLGMAGLVMTTSSATAQARARGRGLRGGRSRFRGGRFRGGPYVYGLPFLGVPLYGYYGYGSNYCERVSWRCSSYGGGYRRCMWRNGC